MMTEILQKEYYDDGRPPKSIHVKNYVPALPAVVNKPGQVLPVQDTSHTLNVPMQSTQHIEMRTSAEDRARGFAISTRQLGVVISTAMLVASVNFANVPLFSFWSLTIFVLTYATVWLWAYWLTLRHSAEGIALLEAKEKWGVVKREQEYRWNHYDQITGGNE